MHLVVAMLVALVLAAGAGPTHADRTVGDLRLEMSVGKASYAPGEPVAVSLRVANTSSAAVVVTTSGQPYDVAVRQRGALVWLWSHDRPAAAAARTQTLGPGDALTFQARWDQRDLQGRQVEPGQYDISCIFAGGQRPGGPALGVGPVRVTISR
jgi:hypothetical protein